MKILITGIHGQLGSKLSIILQQAGHEVYGLGSKNREGEKNYYQIDIRNEEQIKRIEELRPEIIIHSAAWTDVNGAEQLENQKNVYAINVKRHKKYSRTK